MKKVFAVVCVSMLMIAARVQAEDVTSKVDDDGYIRNWLILPSIGLGDQAGTHEEGAQKGMFDKEYYADQNKVAPKAGDKVKVGDKDLAWKVISADDGIINLLKVCEDASVPTVNCLVIGICYILADEDITGVKLKIGSDDSSVWNLNGAEVIRVYAGRATEKDQDTKDGLTLKKGCNVLKFACINGEGDYSVCARFVDKDDKPVKNVKISMTPPAAK